MDCAQDVLANMQQNVPAPRAAGGIAVRAPTTKQCNDALGRHTMTPVGMAEFLMISRMDVSPTCPQTLIDRARIKHVELLEKQAVKEGLAAERAVAAQETNHTFRPNGS